MKTKKSLPRVITAFLLVACMAATSTAIADTNTPTREERVAQIHAKYDPMFADLAARLAVLAPKVKLSPSFNRQYDAVILDFTTMRATINDGLASATGDVEAMGQLAEEETGEFASTIYNLEQDAVKLAPLVSVKPKVLTIKCVKGKAIKKVSGVKPTCPKGYIKKK